MPLSDTAGSTRHDGDRAAAAADFVDEPVGRVRH
jgi:hypothetical protein